MPSEIRKPAKNDKTPRRKKPEDQLSGAMDLFASPKRPKVDGIFIILNNIRMILLVEGIFQHQ